MKTDISENNWKLLRLNIIRYAFLVGIFFIFVSFTFVLEDSVSVTKNIYIALFGLVSLTVIALSTLLKGGLFLERSIFKHPLTTLLLYIFLFLFISTLLGGNIREETYFAFKSFSLTLVGSLIVLTLVTAHILRTKKDVLLLYATIVASGVVVFLIEMFDLFVSNIFSGGVTIVGLQNNLPIFAGFTVLLSTLWLDMVSLRIRHVFLLITALFTSLLLLFLFPYQLVWLVLGLLLFISLIFLLTSSRFLRASGEKSSRGQFPLVTLVICAIAFTVLFIGTEGAQRFAIEPVSEVRLSLKTTLEIAENSYKADGLKVALFGAGINSFARLWNEYKPISVNQTEVALVDFESGIGLLPTSIATTGVLGFSAWSLLLIFFLITGIKRVNGNIRHLIPDFHYWSVLILGVYAWVWFVLYIPSPPILALAFLMTGTLIALSRVRVPTVHSGVGDRVTKNIALRLVSIPILTALLFCVYILGTISLSSYYYSRGISLAGAEGSEEAIIVIEKAYAIFPYPLYVRSLSQLRQSEINTLLNSTEELTEDQTIEFNDLANNAIDNAEVATELGPDDYQNWIVLGNIYLQLTTVGIDGALKKGRTAYERAISLSPRNPLPYYLKARIVAMGGRTEEALAVLIDLFPLQEDYEPALQLRELLSGGAVP